MLSIKKKIKIYPLNITFEIVDTYGTVQLSKQCKDNIDDKKGLRNKCNSDNECLKNGKPNCDEDPMCFGVAWNTKHKDIPLRFCRSSQMVELATANSGWRTMMNLDRGKDNLSFILEIQ